MNEDEEGQEGCEWSVEANFSLCNYSMRRAWSCLSPAGARTLATARGRTSEELATFGLG